MTPTEQAREVAEIAERLTPAQTRILMGPTHYNERIRRFCVRGHRTAMWNLCLAKLVSDYIGAASLTPLGLAVRAHLKETSND